uniref:Uncharacterized protein n=1 Tax=Gossypium raimondii TaxID=29730 RepID=A0A0D2UTT1_GOSRA|nr:hypothetical protein B456_011G153600 [Gossypium raimondii]
MEESSITRPPMLDNGRLIRSLLMRAHDTIGDFYAKLCDLSIQAFTLGEDFSNFKLVRKIIRSLLERFSVKLTTIKEAKNLESLKFDEIIGSL